MSSSFGNTFHDTGDTFNALDLASLRLETAPIRAADWIDHNMVDYAIRDILDPMKRLASSRKISQRFIDSMGIIKLGPLICAFVIDYIPGPLGEPLNIFLEFGTKPHDIFGNPYLAWPVPGGVHIGIHDRKPVKHPGFIGYNLLTSLKNWGFVDKWAENLIKGATNYLQENSFE